MTSNNRQSNPDATANACGDLQMAPEEMLALARETAEVLVERIANLPSERAWEGEFKQGLDQLMVEPPEHGLPAADVLRRATRDILPLTLRLDHPRCFGFVPSSSTWPGVLADFLAAGYNPNTISWLVASGPSQVELVVVDWMRRWLGYPRRAGGLMTSGGSATSLDALVAAREAAGNPEGSAVYMSDQSHSAQVRAARIVGVQPECIRLVTSDRHFRIDMGALSDAVAGDRAAGLHPIAVCANAGTGSTGAIDPLGALADYCEDENIWLHVDGAYGGFASITEKGRKLLQGIERADSIGLDAHKWFFQPYEAGCLLVKDAETLDHAFRVPHDMLQDSVWGANHPNFADRGLQHSRVFRALKIWMSVQTFGMAAFRRAVSLGMELASRAEEYISASPVLEGMTRASLGIVCFRINPSDGGLDEGSLDAVNRNVLSRVFWEDRAFMSSTIVAGRFALRMCILNHTTTWNDVRETLETAERFGTEALT